jgi:hypothetical protein
VREVKTYFESRDDKTEADVSGAPAVCFVLESDKVGPGDDEAVGSHLAWRVVARDVRLYTQQLHCKPVRFLITFSRECCHPQ